MNSTYNRIPLYCQLAEQIEENINDGTWKAGTKIPSERELTQRYNMSRITVRNALNELVHQGKLEKVQGKGTYVIGKSIVQNLGNVYSFSKEMEKQGKITSTRLLKVKVVEADFKLALHLGINEKDKVVYIERLRCSDTEQPIMFERTYFSYDKYPFVVDIDLNHKSLYATLENEHHLKINKAIETFKACELNAIECKLLECPKRQYGLLVKRTSYCDDEIVCYSTIVSKGDVFEFTIKLES